MRYLDSKNFSLKGRIRRRICQSFLGALSFPRSFRAYGVGLERTGTTFLYELFEKSFRSAHEPEPWLLLPFHETSETEVACDRQIEKWVRERDAALRLEFEASHPLGPVVPVLSRAFPDSKFILTIRHPKPWLYSVLNWQLYHRLNISNTWGPITNKYYDKSIPHESKILKGLNLYTLDGYFSKWKRHNNMIINNVDRDRLLVVRTDKLSKSIGQIASFVGVSKKIMSGNRRPKNSKQKDFEILEMIDKNLIYQKMKFHCEPLLSQFF